MGKFREIDYGRIRDLAASGASRDAMAQACGLSAAGFYARMKKDEQLAEAVAADGRGRHRKGKPAETAAEPAFKEVQLEADADEHDADADLARCVLLDEVEKAVGERFNLARASAHQIDEPLWKVARAFANGGCLTLEFADVHLLALLPRERRLVRAIWKAVERFEEERNAEVGGLNEWPQAADAEKGGSFLRHPNRGCRAKREI